MGKRAHSQWSCGLLCHFNEHFFYFFISLVPPCPCPCTDPQVAGGWEPFKYLASLLSSFPTFICFHIPIRPFSTHIYFSLSFVCSLASTPSLPISLSHTHRHIPPRTTNINHDSETVVNPHFVRFPCRHLDQRRQHPHRRCSHLPTSRPPGLLSILIQPCPSPLTWQSPDQARQYSSSTTFLPPLRPIILISTQAPQRHLRQCP